MKLLSIRQGFACNSSSTHSILRVKGAQSIPADGSFGWDGFQLTTKEDKLRYLRVILRDTARGAKVDAPFDILDAYGPYEYDDENDYIDHQSKMYAPLNRARTAIDRAWFTLYAKFILRDDIMIAGGNDNDDYSRGPDYERGKEVEDCIIRERASMSAMENGGYWVLFDPEDGSRVRMRFDGSGVSSSNKDVDVNDGVITERARVPELLDVKITDYCAFGCTYCYVDSTEQGQHATQESLRLLADTIGEWGVFEVAIGGGEANTHPNLMEFAQRLREKGVVPNVTTRDLSLVDQYARGETPFGALAYSVDRAEQVDSIRKRIQAMAKSLKKDEYEMKSPVIQYVIGITQNEETVRKIFQSCRSAGFRLVLLGFKDTGRGDKFLKKASVNWLKIADEERMLDMLGIDTALANEFSEQIKAYEGIDPRSVSGVEGQFSGYIDAVKMTMHKSSYDRSVGISLNDEELFVDSLDKAWKMLPT